MTNAYIRKAGKACRLARELEQTLVELTATSLSTEHYDFYKMSRSARDITSGLRVLLNYLQDFTERQG